ncbi:MAG TPA: DUF1036 domain-containing protein [Gemmataceae bacterium]|jgi:uncharacterized membrane protein
MQVHFKNNYPKKVWVAIMRRDTNACGGEGGGWATAGWWVLDPGQTKNAFSTTNEYAAFYAESEDGAMWNGSVGPVYVYSNAFNSCLNIGSTAAIKRVGMQQIQLPAFRGNPLAVHTVNLNR